MIRRLIPRLMMVWVGISCTVIGSEGIELDQAPKNKLLAKRSRASSPLNHRDERDKGVEMTLLTLPIELLRDHIIAYCDNAKVHQVNHLFFTLVTGYEPQEMVHKGFRYPPTRNTLRSLLIEGLVLNFHKLSKSKLLDRILQEMPSYVWYSLVATIKYMPAEYWSYLKDTQVQKVDLTDNQIGDVGARDFGQALKDTHVHTVYLSSNQIRDAGARDLGQALKDTHVHTINLSHNQIGDAGARDLGQALKDTHVHTINLSNNRLYQETELFLRKLLPSITFTF